MEKVSENYKQRESHGEDYMEECLCIQVDVDLWDAAWCPTHGTDAPKPATIPFVMEDGDVCSF